MRTEFRFEGLSLTVRDLEESLRFYRDKLNLKVVYSATPAFAMPRRRKYDRPIIARRGQESWGRLGDV